LTCNIEGIASAGRELGKLRAGKSGVGIPAGTRGFSLFHLSRPALEPLPPTPFLPGFFPEGQVARA